MVNPFNHLKKTYYSTHELNDRDVIVAFNNQDIYLTKELTLLNRKDIPNTITSNYFCFAEDSGKRYLLLENNELLENEQHLSAHSLKKMWLSWDEELRAITGLACHLNYWRATHQYCGRCGARMQDKTDELARACSVCHYVAYPRISPCIILLITKGDEVILARSPRFSPGVYSTLAGFVDPGESVEEAIVREVQEEVGIKVKNITYFGSQPWPFPDSLMLGFYAEYDSGTIFIDPHEIEDAQWFKVTHLPELTSKVSIARQLIDHYLEEFSKRSG